MRDPKAVVEKILVPADIRINGNRSWDIQVHRSELYDAILSGGSLALGEAYVAGWWDCPALDQFFCRVLEKQLDRTVKTDWKLLAQIWIQTRIFNAQNRSKAFVIGNHHYDTGNDLFAIMLDKGMNYSCGYWRTANTLDEAQESKLELICRKTGLEKGMRVLDVGCGWGGFARYAADRYGVSVLGVTVSRQQAEYARDVCRGLDVTIRLMDYRELDEKFDRIISIGMFEHVGYKNYRTFMRVIHRCLKDDGLFLLHTIGGNTSVHSTDPWINKYIFPNSMLPSARQITAAAEGLFALEDWHCFGAYYDTTLMAWYNNFAKNYHKIKDTYDSAFYRMWTYYLLSCAGSFRSGRNRLWQILFSRRGAKRVYRNRDQYLF